MPEIYQDKNWPYGLRCTRESCKHLFVDGEEIRRVILPEFSKTIGDAVFELVCADCYGKLCNIGGIDE